MKDNEANDLEKYGPQFFEYENQIDPLITTYDLEKMEREFNHNLRKQQREEKKALREEARQAHRARNPARPNAMGIFLGNENDINDLNAGQNRNANAANNGNNNLDEHGMVIPPSMRNYQERTILGGFAKLKRCDRCDLFWGRVKDVERDLVRSHLFILALSSVIIMEILIGTKYSE